MGFPATQTHPAELLLAALVLADHVVTPTVLSQTQLHCRLEMFWSVFTSSNLYLTLEENISIHNYIINKKCIDKYCPTVEKIRIKMKVLKLFKKSHAAIF